MQTKSRVAIITGGARGIGAAVARRLAADGFAIAINYNQSEQAANRLAQEIIQAGGKAVAVRADITQLASNHGLFAAVMERLGRLDALVCSAGLNILGRFTEIDEAAYDRLFAVTKGTYFAMQNAISHMAENGRIVALSTGMTRNWAPGAAAYAGSKAAIEQFTRSLSKEAGARGITVNAVLPGVVLTDMTSAYPAARLEAARQQTSFNRLGTTDDIADVISFLVSERARWITGQLIVANGGSTP